MGRNIVFKAGSIGLVVAIAGCGGGRNVQLFPVPPRADVTVNVEVLCRGANVTVNVDDWEVEVRRGYGVNWDVTGEARVQILPTGTWPFPERPTIEPGNIGSSGRSDTNEPPGRHKYTMIMTCPPQGDNPAMVLRIDPDIIITE